LEKELCGSSAVVEIQNTSSDDQKSNLRLSQNSSGSSSISKTSVEVANDGDINQQQSNKHAFRNKSFVKINKQKEVSKSGLEKIDCGKSF